MGVRRAVALSGITIRGATRYRTAHSVTLQINTSHIFGGQIQMLMTVTHIPPLSVVIPKMATVCLIWQGTFWSGALTNTMQVSMVFLKARTRYRVQTRHKK